MGRELGIPLPALAPPAPVVQTYQLPGMSNIYKFHWKKLKDTTPETSAITDFSRELLPMAPRTFYQEPVRPALFAEGNMPVTALPVRIVSNRTNDIFNPILLAAIEWPTGQIYKFTYNIRGEIEQIKYPTGGEEHFNYFQVPPMDEMTGPYAQANRGVNNRKVYVTTGSTPSEWNYSVEAPDQSYAINIDAPDGTRTKRFLYKSNGSTTGNTIGNWGYDNGLAGISYEEQISKLATGQMLGISRSTWQITSKQVGQGPSVIASWHPRISEEEGVSYDSDNNSVSKKVAYEYDGDLNAKDATLNIKKTTHYGFVNQPAGYLRVSPTPCPDGVPPPCLEPSPNPTPTPVPPAPPVRIVEATYLVNDPEFSETVRNEYRARNMNGLITKTVLKTGTGQMVAQSKMSYDETAISCVISINNWVCPSQYRGNPTSSSKWLNTNSTWQTARTQFDQFGNPVMMEDARGKKTWLEYSPTFQYAYATKTTTSVPDSSGVTGSSTAFTSTSDFDFTTGLVKSTVDSNGQTTTLSYKDDSDTPDSMNRLRKVTRPDGSWTKYSFSDVPGDLYAMTESPIDATRTVKSYSYLDGLGRGVRSFTSEDAGSFVVSDTQYDSVGRPWRVSSPYRTDEASLTAPINPPDKWTTTEYDDLSRPKKVTLTDNTFIQNTYANNVTIVTDQAGRQRRQISNSLGQMVRIDEPNASGDLGTLTAPKQPTSFEYDGLSNLVHIAQNYDIPNNRQGDGEAVQHRYFKYDSLGRIMYERHVEPTAPFAFTDPVTNNNNWSRKFVYDTNGMTGLLTEMYDARNVSTKYTYDSIDRITKIQYSDGTPTVKNFYDQARNGYSNQGRLTEVTTDQTAANPKTSQQYDFDLMNRTASHRQIIADKIYATSYAYDLGGQLVSERYPSGRVVRNNFNNAGQLQSVNAPSGYSYINSIQYAAHGAITSEVLGNGIAASYSYNDRFQITGISWQKAGAQIERYAYKYGQLVSSGGTTTVDTTKNVGQLATTENWIGNDKQYEQRFSYDGLGRLTNSTEVRGDNGNTAYSQTFGYDVFGNRYYRQANNAGNPVSQTWTETADINKSTNRFTANVSYDATGNITVDAKFRLRQYEFDANGRQRRALTLNGVETLEQAVYDGLGQRVVTYTGGVVRHSVYDAMGKMIAEYDNATPVPTPGRKYLLTDKSGSVNITTDSQGAVISRQDYAAFGEGIYAGVGRRTTAQGFNVNDQVRQGFNGLESDEATGLTHTLWRKYDSSSGRWTTPDPYGGSLSPTNPQSYNRYNYVENDPANLTDTSGLLPDFWGHFSAEYSNEEDYNERHGAVAEAQDFYYQRWAPQQAATAQSLLDRGFIQEAKAIVDSNPYLQYDPTGRPESQFTVTVEAIVGDPPQDEQIPLPADLLSVVQGNQYTIENKDGLGLFLIKLGEEQDIIDFFTKVYNEKIDQGIEMGRDEEMGIKNQKLYLTSLSPSLLKEQEKLINNLNGIRKVNYDKGRTSNVIVGFENYIRQIS